MPNPADSNLLFGIIALQMDFIDRDALVDAMQAWTLSKAKSLGEILIERGDLTESRHGLLQPLVEEHLKQHDDDPQKSLLSLAATVVVRDALQEVDDEDVQKSLTHVSSMTHGDAFATQPASSSSKGSVYDTVPSPATDDEDGTQRFRVLRPHASGGLGQISVALDKELHREVALKELQIKYASNEQTRDRFMLEAEITGGLEHPGIVPVYGLGHYEDGRPFYAMRFIRGDNLQEAIEQFHEAEGPHRDPTERNLELRKLLRRFIDVCDAIQYAHSRGVLHRDLKPGNIMLGKYGETLVVDWGLAKPLDAADGAYDAPIQLSSGSGSAVTQMGSVIGTLGYMSPEQAAGRLDLLGPASDIYGLGATLYHLLVSHAPFYEKTKDILKKIETGKFERPREVDPNVPPALESICLKALSVEPEDRYESAFDLAVDVEHWLADEPVAAHRDRFSTRLRRWARRHRTLVTSGAAAVGVAIVLLTVSLILLQSAYQREQRSAELARRTVDEYFTQVSEGPLLNQPGMHPLRRDLLQRALEHYERFIDEHSSDQTLHVELGLAHFRIAQIHEAISSSELAIDHYSKTISHQKQLVADKPDDVDRRYDLAKSYNAMGRAYKSMGQNDEAAKSFGKAAVLRDALSKSTPQNVEFSRTLANSHMNLGILHRVNRKLDQAQQEMETAQSLRQQALTKDETHRHLNRDFGIGLYNLANLAVDEKKPEQAARRFDSAIDKFEKLLDQDTPDFEIQHLLAIACRRLGDLKRSSDIVDAKRLYEKALITIEPLANQNKRVREFQLTYAGVLINVATLEVENDDLEGALSKYQVAKTRLKRLVDDDPKDIVAIADYAAALTNLGKLNLWLERPQEAASELNEAMLHTKSFLSQAKSKRHQWIDAMATFQTARINWSKGQYEKASDHFEWSLKPFQQFAKDDPKDERIQKQSREALAETYAFFRFLTQHSVTENGKANPDAAKREAELLDQLKQIAPNEDHVFDAVQRLHTIGRLQWAADDLETAQYTLELAHENWRGLVEQDPKNEERLAQKLFVLGDVAAILVERGKIALSNGQNPDAKLLLKNAQSILQQLVKENPDDEYFARDLADVNRLLGG